jgi:hypothetical protein
LALCEPGMTRKQPFSWVLGSSATHTVQLANGRMGQRQEAKWARSNHKGQGGKEPNARGQRQGAKGPKARGQGQGGKGPNARGRVGEGRGWEGGWGGAPRKFFVGRCTDSPSQSLSVSRSGIF